MSYFNILNTLTSVSASQIDDPQTLTGLFPPDSDDDEADDDPGNHHAESNNNTSNCYEIQSINFVGKTILVRQYDYHSHNANRIWPGAFPLAEYLLQERPIITESSSSSSSPVTAQVQDSSIENRRCGKYVHQWGRILELGAATGLLAMRLAMASTERYKHDSDCDDDATNISNKCCCTSIVTSDVDDEYGDISANLLYNYTLNHMTLPLPYHIPHTWGTGFQQSIQNVIDQEMATALTSTTTNSNTELESTKPKPVMINSDHSLLLPFDTIIASDILLYVSSYPALVATLSELMIPSSVSLPQEGDNDDTMSPPISPSPSHATTTTTTTTIPKNVTATTVPTKFIMSWNRRLKESQNFFVRMNEAGFTYEHHGKGIYTFVYDHHRHRI